MIDGRNFFDQPVKNNLGTYKIWKVATGQGNGYTIGCLLDYTNFENYYNNKSLCWSKSNAMN